MCGQKRFKLFIKYVVILNKHFHNFDTANSTNKHKTAYLFQNEAI